MKKILSLKNLVRITAVLLIFALLPSCSETSLRKHDTPPVLNVVFMHVGSRGNDRLLNYPMYADSDIEKLMSIGVNEVCIAYGSDVVSYTPDGASEPVEIVTVDDVYNEITKEVVDGDNESGTKYLMSQTVYSEKLQKTNKDLYMEDQANAGLKLAERLVNANPDIKIWYSFPHIIVQALAGKYLEPWTQYYNYMKNSTPAEVWEKNIVGFYWLPEDVTDVYARFNTENDVDFDNAMVRLMKDCAELVHNDDKLTFWCPYYAPNTSTATTLGYIANRTDIFDYVILQPGHLFVENWKDNIDRTRNCAEQNTVLDMAGNVIGGEKISSTVIGPEIEMEGSLFTGNRSEEMKARYRDYYDAYHNMYGTWSTAFYCGERSSIMTPAVFDYLDEYLNTPA